MHFIPPEKIGIKVDHFRQLKYSLRLWAQRDDLLILCFFLFFLKLFGFVSRTIFILKSMKDPEVLLEVSATYPIPLLAIAKMGFLLVQRKRIAVIFNIVSQRFWEISVGGEDLKISYDKWFKFVNLFLLGHFSGGCMYVIMHLVFPYVPIPEGRTRWLPTLITFPFNQDMSPIYEILFVVLSWNMFMSVFGNGFFDLIFVYAAQHVCAQFQVLKVVLRKIESGLMEGYDDVAKFNSESFQREVQYRVGICIKHHNLLLRFCSELQSLTSLIFGVQCLTTLATLVLMGYKLTEDFDKVSQSTMLLSFVASSILQFSIFALQSEEIRTQSASVAEAVYQCNWYLFNADVKRKLTMLIMNSQKGICMTGAGLTEMNNEIIVTMGQRVFSFITLLRSFEEAAEN